jgi:hypothetical protein
VLKEGMKVGTVDLREMARTEDHEGLRVGSLCDVIRSRAMIRLAKRPVVQLR